MAAPTDREIIAARAVRSTFRRTFRGVPTVPTPIDDIAESLFSLRIVEDAWMSESGTLDPAAGIVRVNAAECAEVPMRRRFTVAHEVGHLVLHAPGTAGVLFCRVTEPTAAPVKDPREREANRFAAELLMPEDAVRTEAARLGPEATALAELFQVSEPAMGWRLYNLGLSRSRPDQSA